MRQHFADLVEKSVRLANPDPRRIAESVREAFSNRDRARQQVRDSGVLGLIASPEQREVIQQIAGLMSLLEGHGDVTMSRAVGDLVPSARRFSAVLQARRRRSNPLTRLVLRLTGIEGKLNQYAAGERFIFAQSSIDPHAIAFLTRQVADGEMGVIDFDNGGAVKTYPNLEAYLRARRDRFAKFVAREKADRAGLKGDE